MKRLLIICLLLTASSSDAREWRTIRKYERSKGTSILTEGDWLKKDRKRNTEAWKQANRYNIKAADGYTHYTSFAQKRDFYKWVDAETHQQGHEVKWAGNAYFISQRLVYLDNVFVRALIIHDRRFMTFVHNSNDRILEYILPELSKLYEMQKPLKGETACNWDSTVIYKEQCSVLDTLYQQQPERVLKRFGRMASGRGIYVFAVPKKLRMHGNIKDCVTRCRYGLHTMEILYKEHKCSN